MFQRGGGSEKIAKELFDMFKDNQDVTEITSEEVEKKLPDVLKLFEKQGKEDPSGDIISCGQNDRI